VLCETFAHKELQPTALQKKKIRFSAGKKSFLQIYFKMM
jgi:hypothetical protein